VCILPLHPIPQGTLYESVFLESLVSPYLSQAGCNTALLAGGVCKISSDWSCSEFKLRRTWSFMITSTNKLQKVHHKVPLIPGCCWPFSCCPPSSACACQRQCTSKHTRTLILPADSDLSAQHLDCWGVRVHDCFPGAASNLADWLHSPSLSGPQRRAQLRLKVQDESV